VDKRLWINIGLLAFIILMSVVLINTEEEIQELPRLSTIDHNDIIQIQVLRKDKEDYIFSKQGEAWQMNSPQQFRANISRINAMLRILNIESHSQLDPAKTDLKAIGLTDPAVVMKLNDHEFKFGNTDAIDHHRYVLFNGKIYLTNDFLYHQLMANTEFFADTRLLPEKMELNSIQFPENKIELIDGQWHVSPLLNISPDQLKRIVSNWKNSSAISTSKYEAPETESIIKISSADNVSIQFVIVSTEPHLILGRKDIGIQYNMASDEARKLMLSKEANIDKEAEPIGLELR
jgi:uncharacterized protein DUF4340